MTANSKDGFPLFYRQQELLDNIGISYRHNGDIDSSIVYFDMVLDFVNAKNKKFNYRSNMVEMARGVIYGNKAEALIIKKQYNPAKGLLRKSIAINLRK